MRKIKLFKKSCSYLLLCLILLAIILPNISAITLHYRNDRTQNQAILLNQDIEITFYGSHYIKKNKPFNETTGIYAEIIYHGEGSIIMNVSIELQIISTNPFSWNEMIGEYFELPAEVTGNVLIGGIFFGFGVFSYTILIDGCRDYAGIHYEKTAYGVCVRDNGFIVFQQYK